MTPAELAAVDPLRHRPEQAACRTTSSSIPTPNDPGIDGYNLVGYRFAAPHQERLQHVHRPRRLSRASPNQSFFGRVEFPGRRDRRARRSIPGSAPRNTTRTVTSRGFAFGWDSVLVVERWSTRSATA